MKFCVTFKFILYHYNNEKLITYHIIVPTINVLKKRGDLRNSLVFQNLNASKPHFDFNLGLQDLIGSKEDDKTQIRSLKAIKSANKFIEPYLVK